MQLPNSIMINPTDNEEITEVFNNLQSLSSVELEPVGRWYDIYAQRRRQKHAISYHSINSSSSEEEIETSDDDENEGDEELLRCLDPKDWKNQDHYAVLGLGKKRYEATNAEIKKAYKKKVLKHHPDKRKARGLTVKQGDDDYFTCITRAYEVLGVPTKRRAYDSVDSEFDDRVPNVAKDKTKFFKIFGPVFKDNSRWSTRRRTPLIGDENSTQEEVDDFYDFWYNFSSWREYSYLDEEDKEKGECREERKYIERQNKIERTRRKKEESARIRLLVDNAYKSDPRIARFKEEEQKQKEAQRQAKRDAFRAKQEKERKQKEEASERERIRREKREAEAKAQAEEEERKKQEFEKSCNDAKQKLRDVISGYKYFTSDESTRLDHMISVDLLANCLSLVKIQELNESLESGDEASAKKAFVSVVTEVKEEQERERNKLFGTQGSSSGANKSKGQSKRPWADDEMALLIKAVTLFPAGTVSRWETIADYITQHCSHPKRSDKEILYKVKELQKMDPKMKQEINKKAFDKFEQKNKPSVSKVDPSQISQRLESAAESQVYELGSNPAPWNKEEQSLLETALRKFPASTPQRWDKIAEQLPNRSKKDCMKRYKELVEMIQAKKIAAAQAKKK